MAIEKKKKTVKKQPTVVDEVKDVLDNPDRANPLTLPPKLVGAIADEVAKTLVQRIPSIMTRPARRRPVKKKDKKLEHAYFLDTSAINDGRIFDVIDLHFLNGVVVIPEIKRISGKVVSMMWRSSFKVFVSAPPVAPVAPTFPV